MCYVIKMYEVRMSSMKSKRRVWSEKVEYEVKMSSMKWKSRVWSQKVEYEVKWRLSCEAVVACWNPDKTSLKPSISMDFRSSRWTRTVIKINCLKKQYINKNVMIIHLISHLILGNFMCLRCYRRRKCRLPTICSHLNTIVVTNWIIAWCRLYLLIIYAWLWPQVKKKLITKGYIFFLQISLNIHRSSKVWKHPGYENYQAPTRKWYANSRMTQGYHEKSF